MIMQNVPTVIVRNETYVFYKYYADAWSYAFITYMFINLEAETWSSGSRNLLTL